MTNTTLSTLLIFLFFLKTTHSACKTYPEVAVTTCRNYFDIEELSTIPLAERESTKFLRFKSLKAAGICTIDLEKKFNFHSVFPNLERLEIGPARYCPCLGRNRINYLCQN